MTINQFRGLAYRLLKYLGDWQAVRSKRKGAIKRRVARRIIGKITGRAMGGMFR